MVTKEKEKIVKAFMNQPKYLQLVEETKRKFNLMNGFSSDHLKTLAEKPRLEKIVFFKELLELKINPIRKIIEGESYRLILEKKELFQQALTREILELSLTLGKYNFLTSVITRHGKSPFILVSKAEVPLNLLLVEVETPNNPLEKNNVLKLMAKLGIALPWGNFNMKEIAKNEKEIRLWLAYSDKDNNFYKGTTEVLNKLGSYKKLKQEKEIKI